MARSIHDFKDSDILAFIMDGRMVVVNDGDDRHNTTLVMNNEVVYSNTREGMIKMLQNPQRFGSKMHKDYKSRCPMLAQRLIWAMQSAA
ncbi:hypothetical protein P46FS4_28 [Salmonella phage P46FS4]|uniref:Uncharacterized protein n=1 Tax=Salmonella phage P46FS4 TaxID=2712940 RepID=A0A6G6XTD1_9CAUD|nr:hypothetical protein HYQ39_gp028 [Salmonella phage P46FS4]QIG62094.1 hypothetical protein P46FS4_28 [Salmonella phage P46FS4]